MMTVPRASADARTAFHQELRETTRSTSIPAGGLILVAFLGWAWLDRVLEPANADAFLLVRLAGEAVVAVILALIVLRKVRGVALDWASFAMLATVQVAIAWMLPRVVDSFEAYLLGFSLALYGSAIVVAWRWQFTALLSLVSVAALTSFQLLDPSTLGGQRATIAGFYLGTASLVAIVAQYLRYQGGWREFQVRAALEEEQRHREILMEHLSRLSREDELTALLNRRGWREHLEEALVAARERGGGLGVVLVDLDRFKRINDEHGHAVGDEVLRRAAARLQGAVRPTDTVARLGGDEFAIVCPGADERTAVSVATRIVEAARTTPLRDLGIRRMSVSVGVAMLSDDDRDIDDLIHRADAQAYRAKEHRDAAWLSGRRCDVSRRNALSTTP
jgi:diguanylate cyclase (GGDEF)-like protein